MYIKIIYLQDSFLPSPNSPQAQNSRSDNIRSSADG